jgi:hypothetical protein
LEQPTEIAVETGATMSADVLVLQKPDLFRLRAWSFGSVRCLPEIAAYFDAQKLWPGIKSVKRDINITTMDKAS